MISINSISAYIEDTQESVVVIFDHGTGRTYADNPELLKDIRENLSYSDIKVKEIMWLSEKNAARLIYQDRMERVPTIETVYERTQHYGGPEEGGWYYHNMNATDIRPDMASGVTDLHGEGFLVYKEILRGQHENTHKPHYC